MDDMIELHLLLDYYGQILTSNQQRVMELHLYEDWSLSEIAEYLGISRQGAHDFVKKSKALLMDYENKLNIVKRAMAVKSQLNLLINICNDLEKGLEDEQKKDLCRSLKNGLNKLLEEV